MEGHGHGGGGSSRPPAPPVDATKAGRSKRQHHQQRQVKVKHIVTREVSTDEANFKDVVQRLTGKDSAAARAAVVADATSWSGGATVTGGSTYGVNSGAIVSQDYVAQPMVPSEQDTRWWWAGGGLRQ